VGRQSAQQPISHNYAIGFFALLMALDRILDPHLSKEVFKDIVDMPILLGRGFVEGKLPCRSELLYGAAMNLAFSHEV